MKECNTLSLKGCQIVAGGRSEAQTTGKPSNNGCTLGKGARATGGTPPGVRLTTRCAPVVYASLRPPATFAPTLRVEEVGGQPAPLRFAVTTGYSRVNAPGCTAKQFPSIQSYLN
jgi:hypothetical protein